MDARTCAISLKIPDNEAYTAMRALERLGVTLGRVERADILLFRQSDDERSLRARIEHDERLFNPNKHRLDLFADARPRPGEAWIERLDMPEELPMQPYVSWRLFDADGSPVTPGQLERACELLLCNSAIERAIR